MNFAFGAVEFDVARDQPHPPGFPAWIFLVRGLLPITGSANGAMVVLSIAFSAGAAVVLWFTAARLGGLGAAVSTTAMFLFAPLAVLHSVVALTYSVDFFTSCLLGWMAG